LFINVSDDTSTTTGYKLGIVTEIVEVLPTTSLSFVAVYVNESEPAYPALGV
jgi:hypothetical protein